MTGDPEPRLLRRATAAIAGQVAAAVAATVVLVSALAFSLTIRAEHLAEERTVRSVTLAAGPDLVTADGVVLLRRAAGGSVAASAGAPPAALGIDVTRLRSGRGNASAGGRHYEAYAVDGPDGSRTVGLLDVTAREESGERLVRSLLIAGLAGIGAAAALGAVLGRRAVRPLARALSLQRRFVADASHELRTPLAVLRTRAELLQRRLDRGAGDERTRADAAELVADTRALGEVVEDLLLSAELPHRPARGVPVDAAGLAREVTASVEPYAAAQDVTLRTEIGAGALVVTGVRSSLRRALAALVDNALGHVSAGGTVTVAVSRADGRVCLAVVDDGVGLDPGRAEALLARFARGDEVSDRPGRRFGLGLALVREVLQAHGGDLRIEGSPGDGARFTMVLPAGRADPGPSALV
ncbi:HAMP domain-containing sensor histidine kinase [Dactylosporangium sp. AC04546]|uniref:sensor histidine kinase n=1 Tax=Dactylosporangium sp. AC04546 TaxID=2862460 RepID=UPI001EDD0418|nr:HAMP domain-containing sensor histidine kinase [Dactylosporangium sp. AC04546]WVK78689.1 HAMP domain-containing sensor histidine kinase [Dactylosporangium sp. AC04546]